MIGVGVLGVSGMEVRVLGILGVLGLGLAKLASLGVGLLPALIPSAILASLFVYNALGLISLVRRGLLPMGLV